MRNAAETLGVLLFFLSVPLISAAQLSFVDDGFELSVVDTKAPILTYRYASRDPDEAPANSHFIFPLGGLSGESLLAESGDLDGHSGIFWAWHACRVGGRPLDVWRGEDARRVFERWTVRAATAERADLGLQNVWIFTDSGEAQVLESVHITIWPRTRTSQSIDLSVHLRNISYEILEIGGSDSIQGFCLRVAPALKNLTVSDGQGIVEAGVSSVMSPWIDLSYRNARHSTYSGLAIFQHPENPGFSGRNWHLGPDGLVGAGIPSSERHKLKPGQGLHFRYRVYIHDGFGPNQGLARPYADYLKEIADQSRR